MKKFFLILSLILSFVPSVCSASSDDVYVRKDVFEVYMQKIDDKFNVIMSDISEMKQDIKDIKKDVKEVSARVDALSSRVDVLTSRVDGFDSRLGDIRNNMYLWFVVLGAVILFPYIQQYLDWKASRKPQLTIEDVKRLIEESQNRHV